MRYKSDALQLWFSVPVLGAHSSAYFICLLYLTNVRITVQKQFMFTVSSEALLLLTIFTRLCSVATKYGVKKGDPHALVNMALYY